MSDAKRLMLERGNFYLEMKTKDKDGNVISSTPQKWEQANDGSCIVVAPIDSETDEQCGEAILFAAHDTNGVIEHIKANLGIEYSDSPNLEKILMRIKNEIGINPCDYCPDFCTKCSDCPLYNIDE